jgi:hypothetical protein
MSEQSKKRHAADALAHVLGLEEPELSCEECFAQLDRYVELSLAGERADREVPGMRVHLEGCPACAEDFRSLRDFVTNENTNT